VLCDVSLTERTDSREHVVPNAIGGRLKVKGFICKRCNNSAGQDWDAEIATNLIHLSHLVGITRDRGQPPSMRVKTVAGEDILLKSGGGMTIAEPIYSETSTGDGVEVQFSARDMSEARRMLKGVKRKYPSVDVETLLQEAKLVSSYAAPIHVQLELGGELAHKSMIKSLLALARHEGWGASGLAGAIEFLRSSSLGIDVWPFFERDILVERPRGVPLHVCALSADPVLKRVFGYVEYFGVFRFVIVLAHGYAGPRRHAVYAMDPRSGARMPMSVALSFDDGELARMAAGTAAPASAMKAAFGAVLDDALSRQFEVEKSRVISEAVAYGFANCGAREGELLQAEHASRLAALVAERLAPFVLQHLRPLEQTRSGR
jgi:hypothetical protein